MPRVLASPGGAAAASAKGAKATKGKKSETKKAASPPAAAAVKSRHDRFLEHTEKCEDDNEHPSFTVFKGDDDDAEVNKGETDLLKKIFALTTDAMCEPK